MVVDNKIKGTEINTLKSLILVRFFINISYQLTWFVLLLENGYLLIGRKQPLPFNAGHRGFLFAFATSFIS